MLNVCGGVYVEQIIVQVFVASGSLGGLIILVHPSFYKTDHSR